MLDPFHDPDQDVLRLDHPQAHRRGGREDGRQGEPHGPAAIDISADVPSTQELSETALNALLYAKFSSTAESLRILIFELEKRGRMEPTEYAALLQECYTVWFASRGSLLAAPLAEEVRRMDPGSSDLIKLVSWRRRPGTNGAESLYCRLALDATTCAESQ